MDPMTGVRFLIGAVVLALVLYACWLLIALLPLPAPFPTILLIILVLVGIAFLFRWGGWKS